MKHKPIIGKSFQIGVATLLILCLLVVSFLAFSYARSKKHYNDIYNKKGKLIFLTYGLPQEPIRENSDWVIADKWGFTYKGVAGCMVNNELIDSVNAHNEIVDQILIRKNGKNWGKRFDKEVEAEYIKEKIVSDIIDKNKLISQTKALLDKEGNGLDYIIDPIENTTKYNVVAKGWKWNKVSKKDERVDYYKLLVDYKSQKVVLLSSNIEK